MKDRHAYLIIAHNEPKVLETLLKLLDIEWNDVYLHIDKRNPALNEQMSHYKMNKARFFLLPEPIAVYWGHTSQIRVELNLMRAAQANGPYLYYHLLSGCDLPIKSSQAIYDFFHRNQGREFIGFWNSDRDIKDARKKMRFYYVFNRYKKGASFWQHALTMPLRNLFLILQKLFAVNRLRGKNIEIKKGFNWFSITEECCQYILDREPYILKIFNHTLCGDELFLHTLIWRSPFRKALYNTDDPQLGSMRTIDWQRGTPYVWRAEDVDYLLQSPCLFARKFSSSEMETVQNIYIRITQ